MRGNAVAVDLGGDHLACAGLCGGDADKAGAGAEVEHAAAGHALRMVEDIAREHRAAGPGIGPVGRLRLWRVVVRLDRIVVASASVRIGKPPQPAARMGRVELDFGKRGHRAQGACSP